MTRRIKGTLTAMALTLTAIVAPVAVAPAAHADPWQYACWLNTPHNGSGQWFYMNASIYRLFVAQGKLCREFH
jgi:hypothetical protein